MAIPGGERGSHGLAPVGVAQHGADNGALVAKIKMRTKEEHIKRKRKMKNIFLLFCFDMCRHDDKMTG